jgi:TetR/AcrR family transcriptional regulator, repressor for divergent bdcA
MTTNISRRGRPRSFDPDTAVATAQGLVHARGFDAVGVSDLTKAMGINPPSFYAAFGNKAGLYALILQRYQQTGAIPLQTHLRPDVPVAEGLAAILEDAAHHYARDTEATGCLVLEGTHAKDPEARAAACACHRAALGVIRAYISTRQPAQAETLTDFVNVIMSGLSDEARRGASLERLLQSARLASGAIQTAIAAEP